jgi:hypothetical protein
MKKQNFARLGAVATLVLSVPFATATEHTNQAYSATTAQTVVPTSVQPKNQAYIAEATQTVVPTPALKDQVMASPVVAPPMVRTWTIALAETNLRDILTRWSASAGWQVSWELPNDIDISGGADYHGAFEDVVVQVLGDLQGSDSSAAACVYDDNKMVRVVRSTVECDRRKN